MPSGSRPPTHPRTRRLGARESLVCVTIAALLLVIAEGASLRRSGERMESGIARTVVLAVGHPAGWIADQLPFAQAVDDATGFLSPDDDLADAPGGFTAGGGAARQTGVPPVSPDAFDPRELGEPALPRRPLTRLLVTGDSLAMPLDAVLARSVAGSGAVTVSRDPHVGTGISKTALVDWGKLSARQSERERPDAVVAFIGANEGFPMTPAGGGRELECCGPGWAAEFAFRVRRMMDTYRRAGDARVYWLTLPAPRASERARIARAVNAAIVVAAQPYRAHVRVLDMGALFTPGGRYREAMLVGGRERLVREPDGIHLSETGAELAAETVLRALRADFELR